LGGRRDKWRGPVIIHLAHDPALTNLFAAALQRQSQGDAGAALLAYRRLQKRFPDFANAWTNASALLCGMGRLEEALAAAERAVSLDGGGQASFYAVAEARRRLGHFDDALKHYSNVLDLNPAHVPSMLRMAEIYWHAGLADVALSLSETAARCEPENSSAFSFRGASKLYLMDYAGAEADFGRALELDPDNANAHQCLTFVHLMHGRYLEGWRRQRASGLGFWGAGHQDFGKPRWKGEPLEGGTLLVYGQCHEVCGGGDCIQFARLLPRAKELCGCRRLVVYTYRELKRLFVGLPGLDEVAADGEPLPHFDATAPIWALPSITDLELSDMPPPTAFRLTAPPPHLELDGARFKVGLTWAASVGRRLDPRLFDELADTPGADRVAWYGLQVPPDPEPPRLPGFTDMSPRIADFMDTALVVGQLDLAVSVDTAMAHLAGSLGAPTIVLVLQPLPDWRWGLGETTPWYRTAIALRQPLHGDPASVVRQLKAEIARRVQMWRTG
jgi:Tfp pilus assembly protein PilF